MLQDLLFLLQIVDFLQEGNVLLHDSGVLLLMGVLVFGQHSSEAVDVVLKESSLLSVVPVQVRVSLLVLEFLLDVVLVEPDDSLLELLEVVGAAA